MDKKKQIAFNLNNFLLSTSNALDSLESQLFNTSSNHSKRVAYISLKLAQEFNYGPEKLFDLCAFSLMHNIGFVKNDDKNKEYCELANLNSTCLPFLENREEVLKYQCENYDGSGLYGLKADEIPLFSQFISFADFIDTKFSLDNLSIENREDIIEFVKKNETKLFSEDIVECFLMFSEKTSFWLDLQSEHEILTFIFSTIHDYTTAIDFQIMLEYSSIFHRKDNSLFLSNCKKSLEYYSFDHKDEQTFLIAASFYDIGKLFIPQKILNKKEKLTKSEYEFIKSYPYLTKKTLNNIMGFNDITTWASRVQETNDSLGYPFGLGTKDLSFKDRLLRALVVYNSLVNDNSYREGFSHNDAIYLMKELGEKEKLDISIVNDLDEVFK